MPERGQHRSIILDDLSIYVLVMVGLGVKAVWSMSRDEAESTRVVRIPPTRRSLTRTI